MEFVFLLIVTAGALSFIAISIPIIATFFFGAMHFVTSFPIATLLFGIIALVYGTVRLK